MLDFLMISTRPGKRGSIEIYPRFLIGKSSDLMIRGGDFYSVWIEDEKRWSTNEDDVTRIVDAELQKYYEEHKQEFSVPPKIMRMRFSDTGVIDTWHKYCQRQMRDNFHMLDERIIFSNMEPTKKDYASKRLAYPLEPGDISAYDQLMSTLYAPDEREKLEWAVGAIVCGDSKKLQKFVVLYGDSGTGKSTFLDIVKQLFDGYCGVFDAKSLGSSSNRFALEVFKNNPLVAIQHDGDLSKIEDNTRLNSLVSHEVMVVDEKNKGLYSNDFKAFLFMGTNKPVKITDSKSGIIRRLIDVSPSGNLVPRKEYKSLVKQIPFELGAIAWHCKEVYEANPDRYEDYVPTLMLGASNDFYNFMMDSYLQFEKDDGVSGKIAWNMYKVYCEEARVPFPLSQMLFYNELATYFEKKEDRAYVDGARVRNYYRGFKKSKFEMKHVDEEESDGEYKIQFKEQDSIFDSIGAGYKAQYASDNGVPLSPWDKIETTLADIDTHKLHYVMVPENHIVIDFDIPDENGNKCFERNLEEASKWPHTYAELSKSGAGIHLHYIYNGDVSELSRVYADHIEIKVFNGNASLRRQLSKCNNLSISTINSGLPLREKKKSVEGVKIKSEKKLLEMIERNLRKEIHDSTKCSCDFIYKIVEDAYNDGFSFVIPANLREKIVNFAQNSTHNCKYCVKLMKKMHYQSKDNEMKEELKTNNYKIREYISSIIKSDEADMAKFKKIKEYLAEIYRSGDLFDVTDLKGSLLYAASNSKTPQYCLNQFNNMVFQSEEQIDNVEKPESSIIFYDIEVFPNLLLVNWKVEGEGKPVIRWINPTPEQIEELIQFRLIGFNCRRYDNHIIYARMMGYDNEKLYKLSRKIVNGGKDCFFGEAYNLSYTDIYDFASAANKMSLKKMEIRMGIHHKELGLPWDQPVPEEKWDMVAEYCDNDVIATEAAFNFLKADWTAREILSSITGMTVNDTTNSLTTRMTFGKNRNPQSAFNYRDLSKPVKNISDEMMAFLCDTCPDMMSYQHGPARSVLPYFPGYKYEAGKSTYRGEEVGEGGYVYAEPGIYTNVALLDIASMHPHSILAECLFGVEYTTVFRELVQARVHIKHEQWSKVDKMLGGKLKPFTEKVRNGEMSSKDLANALKTAINAVYGLTAAQFENAFRDTRNVDNIVAKRGALFMVDLKHAVQEKGFTVAHIKTDSIKIPNATPEIIQFVMDFGKQYGYTFEHEATYEKMCLVNDAVYIAKYADGDHEYELSTGEKIMTPWTATGTQFAVPYVFKNLFSKTPYKFEDFCETKSVSTALYLDFNEGMASEDDHDYHFIGKVGQFCPVKSGFDGGLLCREKDGKFNSANGSKGYRWMESEMVRSFANWEDVIDRSYYTSLVDAASDEIKKYGDLEWFTSDKEKLEICKGDVVYGT